MNTKVIIFLAAAYLVSAALPAAAAPSFFSHDGARTIFNNDIHWQEADEIVYLPPKAEELPPEEEEALLKPVVAGEPVAVAAVGEAVAQPTRSAILAKYGNPQERVPVLADEKAPQSYKALLEAINIGDQDLAFLYARQYYRYVDDLQGTVQRAVALMGVAGVKDGILPPDSWAMSDDYREFHHYLAEEPLLQEKSADEDPEAEPFDSDEARRALIRRALASGSRLYGPAADFAQRADHDEVQERVLARRTLGAQVPANPQADITIMVFLRLNEAATRTAASDLQKLARRAAADPTLKFQAFALDNFNEVVLRDFQRATKTDFSIIAGQVLAQSLDVQASPTLVFFDNDSQQSHTESGGRSFYYWDEIINLMQGVKP